MASEVLPASDAVLGKSAGELVQAVAARKLSASEIVQAFLDRLEQVNPLVNAVCTVAPGALEAAARADRRLAGGAHVRPLEGVPFVVKDTIETRDLLTTFGSETRRDYVPEEDAISVERLLAAGAIVLGKSNTPEFAHDVFTTNRLFGPTRNPWDLAMTAGGSSGGTAAALAADMAPIGLGTDFGGSIRIPSAFCGTVGLRPVPGRVPVYPNDFGWDTLVPHVHGPMARCVADLGLALSVLAGPDDRDPSSLPDQGLDLVGAALGRSGVAGRRAAFTLDLGGLVPVDAEVIDIAARAARQFEALGCAVEQDAFDASDLSEIISGTRGFAVIARHGERVARHRDQLTSPLLRQVEDASGLDIAAVARAERMRTAYWHRVRSFLQRYDYVLTPTVGAPAFALDQPLASKIGNNPVARLFDTFLLTYAFSITGLPAASVPCGLTRSGLPVGLQIVGRRLREDLVLEAAAAYTAAYPLAPSRPSL